MKKHILLLLVSILTIVSVAALGISGSVQTPSVSGREGGGFPMISVPHIPVPDIALPKSLDNFFPPKAPGPVWLFKMFEMGETVMGIADDISENEFENAKNDFKNFKAKYEETRKLVPEWTGFFPTYPLNSLEAALESGNKEKAMAAFGNMMQVCENCHIINMPKVQYKYHWTTPDGKTFSEISVKDPKTDKNISFKQLMLAIDINFNGIGADLRQNQIEQAKGHSQGLNATFHLMKETCKNCHATERRYYVDADVQAMVDELGQVINESPINMTKVGMLSQGIGDSCLKCHWVHFPAATAQARQR